MQYIVLYFFKKIPLRSIVKRFRENSNAKKACFQVKVRIKD